MFDSLAKIISKLGFNNVSIGSSSMVGETSSVADVTHVYGRDDDREKIIELLLKDEPKLSVISILAMGGVGKTTLAQIVYNDQRVKRHFDKQAWTCVGQGRDDFNVRTITKSILKSVGFAASGSDDLLQDKLKEALTGKKFLIVFDDVWDDKDDNWKVLRTALSVGAPGCKIIVTTRLERVGSIMGSVSIHHLQVLSHEACWELFVEHAFGNRNIDTRSNLDEIGKKIVGKCYGLPLEIKMMGGLLGSKLKEDEWEDILNSTIWKEQNDIIPTAFRLSFDYLPPHLKPCFAYCSIFSYGDEFEEIELVRQWIDKGLVQPNGTRQIKDFAVEYFRDLLSRSFFQQSSNNKSRFIMHDLVHDLARWVASERGFGLKDKLEDKYNVPKKHDNFQGFWKWLFVISNVSFEILASAFDQVSSPNKPGYALAGLVMSLVAVAVCVTEFVWKAQKEKVTIERWGLIWWVYHPSPICRLYGTFAEIFGIICAILQVIFSAIECGLFLQHAENPIKMSIFLVIFALCVSGSKLINNPNERPREGHSEVVHRETELKEIGV